MVVSSKVKMSISLCEQITKYDQHVLSQLPAETIYLIIILSVTDNISQTVNRNRTKQLLVFVLAGSRNLVSQLYLLVILTSMNYQTYDIREYVLCIALPRSGLCDVLDCVKLRPQEIPGPGFFIVPFHCIEDQLQHKSQPIIHAETF